MFKKQNTFWRTKEIPLGIYESAQELAAAVRSGGFGIDPLVEELVRLGLIQVASRRHDIVLVKMALKEIGLVNGAEFDEIIAAGKRQGLAPVPAEAAFQLRFKYPYQKSGEHVRFAMRPIVHGGGKGSSILSVYNGYDMGLPGSTLRLGANMTIPNPQGNLRKETMERQGQMTRWGKTTIWVWQEREAQVLCA